MLSRIATVNPQQLPGMDQLASHLLEVVLRLARGERVSVIARWEPAWRLAGGRLKVGSCSGR